jgi:hypothetical protein
LVALLAACAALIAAAPARAQDPCIYNPVNGNPMNCQIRPIIQATGAYAQAGVVCLQNVAGCSREVCYFNPLSGEPQCVGRVTNVGFVLAGGVVPLANYIVACLRDKNNC